MDENTDKELAKLLTQNGIVRAASASLRGNLLSDHFRILGEKVYTIHIYGMKTEYLLRKFIYPNTLIHQNLQEAIQ